MDTRPLVNPRNAIGIAVINMRVLGYDAKKGSMRVIPENLDDLWTLYNVIRRGDRLYARTSREIKLDVETNRPTKSKRIGISLGIHVDRVSLQRENNRLRAIGPIIEAPEKYGLHGSYHTINVDSGKPITILKEEWHQHDVERVQRAQQGGSGPIIVVSIDDENGCVSLIRQHGIDIKAEIPAKLPGKLEVDKRTRAITRYFESLLKDLILVWSENRGLIAIIGPGFLKERFSRYVRDNRSDVHGDVSAVRAVGSGGVAGVEEAVRSGVLDVVAKKMRMIEETRVVEELLSRLASQQGKVSYGLEDVTKAVTYGSVELLLIADALLREANDEERRELEECMKDVEKMRGRVMTVSSEHEAGRQLLNLGGVAALLRFRIG
jgi:protein pelota